MPPLRQLFYVSRIASGFSDSAVHAILAASRRNNQRRDITGCLIFSGRHFAQMLEGDPAALNELVTRIAADPRHTDLVVLVDRAVRLRQHPEWSMGYLYNLDLVDRLEQLALGQLPAEAEMLELMVKLKTDSVMGSL